MTSETHITVIRKLLLKGCLKSKTASDADVVRWMPSRSEPRTKQVVDELVADADAPVTRYGCDQEIRLFGVKSAVAYIRKHGGEVPSSLEKHLEPADATLQA